MSTAMDLLRRLEPHLDALVCYASTTPEYEPNKLVQEVRALLGAAQVERADPTGEVFNATADTMVELRDMFGDSERPDKVLFRVDPRTNNVHVVYEDADEQDIAFLLQSVPPLTQECPLPPAGWRCTRRVGHDGPCAAVAK